MIQGMDQGFCGCWGCDEVAGCTAGDGVFVQILPFLSANHNENESIT